MTYYYYDQSTYLLTPAALHHHFPGTSILDKGRKDEVSLEMSGIVDTDMGPVDD